MKFTAIVFLRLLSQKNKQTKKKKELHLWEQFRGSSIYYCKQS